MSAAARVEVYSTAACRHCARAKGFLRRAQVDFIERDASSPSARAEMLARAGAATVPQIFVAGELVGGCDALLAAHADGSLAGRFRCAGIAWYEPSAEAPAEPEAPSSDAAAVRGTEDSVLNADAAADGDGDDVDSAACLQQRMLTLYDAHLADDGSRVRYGALRASDEFVRFRAAAARLRMLRPDALAAMPAAQATAFWLNLYNCLVLHATAVLGAPSCPASRKAFFSGATGGAYDVGGLRFSADAIEHGVLRANRAPLGAAGPIFAPADPRARLALRSLDPRIHFALNCGAKSCPPIRLYVAQDIDNGLALAARAFIEGSLEVDPPARVARASKLLDWYGADFGAAPAEILAVLREYLPPTSELHMQLSTLLDAPPGAPPVELRFDAYDWATNGE